MDQFINIKHSQSFKKNSGYVMDQVNSTLNILILEGEVAEKCYKLEKRTGIKDFKHDKRETIDALKINFKRNNQQFHRKAGGEHSSFKQELLNRAFRRRKTHSEHLAHRINHIII